MKKILDKVKWYGLVLFRFKMVIDFIRLICRRFLFAVTSQREGALLLCYFPRSSLVTFEAGGLDSHSDNQRGGVA
jgi:hypothetical protein